MIDLGTFLLSRSQNASFHQTYESAQTICDRILWTANQVKDDSSASLVRLTRARESSPLMITPYTNHVALHEGAQNKKKPLRRVDVRLGSAHTRNYL